MYSCKLILLALALAFFSTGPSWAVDTPYLTRLTKQIEAQPSAQAFADRGFAYAMVGSKRAALRDFRRALQLEPENRMIHWSFGWAAFNLSEYELAVAQWNHVIERDSERPWWAGHTLAIGYWELNERTKALKYFDEAVKARPDFATRKGLLEYTDFWTAKERHTVEAVFDAWKRGYKGL